jgi:hypothetical protein
MNSSALPAIAGLGIPADQGASIAHADIDEAILHDQVNGDLLVQVRNVVQGRSPPRHDG